MEDMSPIFLLGLSQSFPSVLGGVLLSLSMSFSVAINSCRKRLHFLIDSLTGCRAALGVDTQPLTPNCWWKIKSSIKRLAEGQACVQRRVSLRANSWEPSNTQFQ